MRVCVIIVGGLTSHCGKFSRMGCSHNYGTISGPLHSAVKIQ